MLFDRRGPIKLTFQDNTSMTSPPQKTENSNSLNKVAL